MGMTGIISTGGKVSGNLSSGAKTAAAEVDTETRYIPGPKGDPGKGPRVVGELTSIDLLPSPTEAIRD